MELLILAIVLLLLILGSAFFSGSELALMSLSPLKLETAARQGSRLARLQQKLRKTPQRILSTILIGNNLINFTFATLATAFALKQLAPLHGMGEQRALVVSTVSSTLLIVIFGELLPKTLAALNPGRLARFVTYPLYLIDILLTPFNWFVELLLMPLVRLISGGRVHHTVSTSADDVDTALSLALHGGHLHQTDAAFAAEALRFSSKNLGDSMTPRVDVVAVPDTATVGEALTLMSSSGFSRLPVFQGNLDTIIGVAFLKDLMQHSLRAASSGRDPQDLWAREAVTPLMRQPAFFPAGKSVVETLAEMRQQRVHMAVVVDEHGGTAGVVTLEDILEELVGDIRDETDPDHSADVIQRGEGFAIVTGRARLESLEELEGIDIGEAEASTVGGLMMELLGRPAAVGDSIELDGVKITALKVLRTQVKLLRIDREA